MDPEDSEKTPALVRERYAQTLAHLRELLALPLNHQRKHELFHHVFPDLRVLLQIPYSDRFSDHEKVQSEMLAELDLDELKKFTEFLYGAFLESGGVIVLIDRYIQRFPVSDETAEIRKMTKIITEGIEL